MSAYNTQTKSWLITTSNGSFNLTFDELVAYPELNDSSIDTSATTESFNNLDYLINNMYEPICQYFTSILKVLPSYRSYDVSKYLDVEIDSDFSRGQILTFDMNSYNIRGIDNDEFIEYVKGNIFFNEMIVDNKNNQISISVYSNNNNKCSIRYV